ncbi:MAG: hypothetical protein ACYDBJ_24885 [Aggregatilineales bacterium]
MNEDIGQPFDMALSRFIGETGGHERQTDSRAIGKGVGGAVATPPATQGTGTAFAAPDRAG